MCSYINPLRKNGRVGYARVRCIFVLHPYLPYWLNIRASTKIPHSLFWRIDLKKPLRKEWGISCSVEMKIHLVLTSLSKKGLKDLIACVTRRFFGIWEENLGKKTALGLTTQFYWQVVAGDMAVAFWQPCYNLVDHSSDG